MSGNNDGLLQFEQDTNVYDGSMVFKPKHKKSKTSLCFRCEQQFRLHRLLAYDPRNECRGIFAEWFKFPSCCVCKCYDVPLEFRARSPRILHPQYDEEVKRVIYEDVARDWYSMSAYGDDEDLF